MTKRERFLAAMTNKVPDRVPVAPDFSNYIPARRTGLPFWDIYFNGTIPLWQAYLDTADYFGAEAWIASCFGVPLLMEPTATEYHHEDIFDASNDAMIRRWTMRTALGELDGRDQCYRYDPPSPVVKPIKELERDFPIWKSAQSLPRALDMAVWDEVRAACEQREQAFGATIGYPGFQGWMGVVEDGIMQLSVADMETPELLEEWLEWDMAVGTRAMELLIAAKPDYILLGGSGTITLSSPRLARKYALPGLKKFSQMAKEAGIPTMVHSCGKSMALVEMLAEETDVNCLNPLEIPPMGDADLAKVKRKYGQQISLMGNLHTTEVILHSTPQQVQQAAIQAMKDAGQGGGFILSTGDQCPRDTPDENIFALVEAAHTFGVYNQATGTLTELS